MKVQNNGGIIARMGATLLTRKILFYSVCILLRFFLIAILLLVYIGRPDLETVISASVATILFLAAVVNFRLSLQKNSKVWWKRNIHVCILLFATFSAVVSAALPNRNFFAIVVASLGIDVSFGIVHSLIRAPFENKAY